METLAKAGYKRLKEMFQDTSEHDEKVRWVADNIKHEPMQIWMLRNLKRDPDSWNADNLEKVKHMDGMTGLSKEIKSVELGKQDDFDSGMAKLQKAEQAWQSTAGAGLVSPKGEKIVDFGNGMAWYNLGTPSDEEEGRALAHCGNMGDPHRNDRILSLRREVKAGSRLRHEPMLTFIANKGWVGEMKGRANTRPGEKYHPYIAELLKNSSIKGLIGAGYMPEANFHFDDLSQKLKEEVRAANPRMVDLRSDAWNQDEREAAAATAPKLAKYQGVISDLETRRRALGKIDGGTHTLSPNELRTVLSDPRVTRRGLQRVIENVHRFGGRRYADALMKIAAHPKTDDSDIAYLSSPRNAHANNKGLGVAFETLKNHPLIDQDHLKNFGQSTSSTVREGVLSHPKIQRSTILHVLDNMSSRRQGLAPEHPLWSSPSLDQEMFDKMWEASARGASHISMKMPLRHPMATEKHYMELLKHRPGELHRLAKSGLATPGVMDQMIEHMKQDRSVLLGYLSDVWNQSSPLQRLQIIENHPAEVYRSPAAHPDLTDEQKRRSFTAMGNRLVMQGVKKEDEHLLDANHIANILTSAGKESYPQHRRNLSHNYGHISNHPSFTPDHFEQTRRLDLYERGARTDNMSDTYREHYLSHPDGAFDNLAFTPFKGEDRHAEGYVQHFLSQPRSGPEVRNLLKIPEHKLSPEQFMRLADHVDVNTNPLNLMDMMTDKGVSYSDKLRDKARQAHGPGWESVYPLKEHEK